MNSISKDSVSSGIDYLTPELHVESITSEAGYCESVINGNSNECINDAEEYDFTF